MLTPSVYCDKVDVMRLETFNNAGSRGIVSGSYITTFIEMEVVSFKLKFRF